MRKYINAQALDIDAACRVTCTRTWTLGFVILRIKALVHEIDNVYNKNWFVAVCGKLTWCKWSALGINLLICTCITVCCTWVVCVHIVSQYQHMYCVAVFFNRGPQCVSTMTLHTPIMEHNFMEITLQLHGSFWGQWESNFYDIVIHITASLCDCISALYYSILNILWASAVIGPYYTST